VRGNSLTEKLNTHRKWVIILSVFAIRTEKNRKPHRKMTIILTVVRKRSEKTHAQKNGDDTFILPFALTFSHWRSTFWRCHSLYIYSVKKRKLYPNPTARLPPPKSLSPPRLPQGPRAAVNPHLHHGSPRTAPPPSKDAAKPGPPPPSRPSQGRRRSSQGRLRRPSQIPPVPPPHRCPSAAGSPLVFLLPHQGGSPPVRCPCPPPTRAASVPPVRGLSPAGGPPARLHQQRGMTVLTTSSSPPTKVIRHPAKGIIKSF
jgi:hypothetical protein